MKRRGLVVGTLAALLSVGFVFAGEQDPLPARKNYAQEYFQSFKGKPDAVEGYSLRGKPALSDLLKYEPHGVRITLPPNYPRDNAGIGLVFNCTVKGDFEITLDIENLKPPGQDPARNRTAKVSLGAFLDTPEHNEGAISQIMDGRGRIQYSTFLSVTNEEKVYARRLPHYAPAEEKVGRLRLVRSGADLYCYGTQGEDTAFTFLVKHPFRKTDLKGGFFSARTEDANSEVDLRFSALRIRADYVGIGQAPSPTAPPRRALGLLAILVAVSVTIGGLLLWWCKRRGDPEVATVEEMKD